MRKLNIDFDYYISITKYVHRIHDGFDREFNGVKKTRYVVYDDQGLLGIAFLGYIKFYDPDNYGNVNTPYNFRPFVIEYNKQKLSNLEQYSFDNLKPKIIHLLGNKPWTSQQERKNLLLISQQCLAVWDKYEKQAMKVMEGLI